MKYLQPLTAILVTILFISGCATTDQKINTDIPPLKFFQLAQDAYDSRDYDLALEYYKTFIKEYPDEKAKIMEARYEIAFIHYKNNRYQQAEKLFQEIIDTYSEETSSAYPEWPKILSEKLLKKIEEETSAS